MSAPVRFHPQVPHDVAEAPAWYEEISSDLANQFRIAVRQAFAKLGTQPLTYGVAFDDVRIVRVPRFPYLVQYRMHLETPLVLGVFHSSSNPDKWRKRSR